MVRLIGMLIVLGVLLAACGGGDGDSEERVLRLSHGDYPEGEYRLMIRAGALNNPVGTENFCDGLEGLSSEDAIDALIAAAEERDARGLGREVIQEADPDDDRRAATIIVEECERIR